MIVSTDASMVAAITLTTSSRVPSRVHDAKTNPVLRTNRTASRPRSVSIAERKERAVFNQYQSDGGTAGGSRSLDAGTQMGSALSEGGAGARFLATIDAKPP